MAAPELTYEVEMEDAEEVTTMMLVAPAMVNVILKFQGEGGGERNLGRHARDRVRLITRLAKVETIEENGGGEVTMQVPAGITDRVQEACNAVGIAVKEVAPKQQSVPGGYSLECAVAYGIENMLRAHNIMTQRALVAALTVEEAFGMAELRREWVGALARDALGPDKYLSEEVRKELSANDIPQSLFAAVCVAMFANGFSKLAVRDALEDFVSVSGVEMFRNPRFFYSHALGERTTWRTPLARKFIDNQWGVTAAIIAVEAMVAYAHDPVLSAGCADLIPLAMWPTRTCALRLDEFVSQKVGALTMTSTRCSSEPLGKKLFELQERTPTSFTRTFHDKFAMEKVDARDIEVVRPRHSRDDTPSMESYSGFFDITLAEIVLGGRFRRVRWLTDFLKKYHKTLGVVIAGDAPATAAHRFWRAHVRERFHAVVDEQLYVGQPQGPPAEMPYSCDVLPMPDEITVLLYGTDSQRVRAYSALFGEVMAKHPEAREYGVSEHGAVRVIDVTGNGFTRADTYHAEWSPESVRIRVINTEFADVHEAMMAFEQTYMQWAFDGEHLFGSVEAWAGLAGCNWFTTPMEDNARTLRAFNRVISSSSPPRAPPYMGVLPAVMPHMDRPIVLSKFETTSATNVGYGSTIPCVAGPIPRPILAEFCSHRDLALLGKPVPMKLKRDSWCPVCFVLPTGGMSVKGCAMNLPDWGAAVPRCSLDRLFMMQEGDVSHDHTAMRDAAMITGVFDMVRVHDVVPPMGDEDGYLLIDAGVHFTKEFDLLLQHEGKKVHDLRFVKHNEELSAEELSAARDAPTSSRRVFDAAGRKLVPVFFNPVCAPCMFRPNEMMFVPPEKFGTGEFAVAQFLNEVEKGDVVSLAFEFIFSIDRAVGVTTMHMEARGIRIVDAPTSALLDAFVDAKYAADAAKPPLHYLETSMLMRCIRDSFD